MVKLAYPLQATRPRDRILCATLFPIASSETYSRLHDDSISRVAAYIMAAQLLNNTDPSTPFVSMSLAGNTARPGVQRGEAERLPTWVPDWSDPQELDICQLNEPASAFSAWSGHVAITGWNPLSDHSHLQLQFRAVMIDTVQQISSYQPPRRPADRFSVAAMNSLLFSEWWDWLQRKTPDRYKGNEER